MVLMMGFKSLLRCGSRQFYELGGLEPYGCGHWATSSGSEDPLMRGSPFHGLFGGLATFLYDGLSSIAMTFPV